MGAAFPKVPGYAWAWLQRSRPVLVEAADRLTGAPPVPGFVDDLRERFEDDQFTHDVIIDVVAEIAFGGRIPSRRPPGASWDRGLVWWAAALSGTNPTDFEGRADSGSQAALFDVPPLPQRPAREPKPGVAARRAGSQERAALANALRDLIASADGDTVPVLAVRQLLAQLAPDAAAPDTV